jgi:hypothetical protein
MTKALTQQEVESELNQMGAYCKTAAEMVDMLASEFGVKRTALLKKQVAAWCAKRK